MAGEDAAAAGLGFGENGYSDLLDDEAPPPTTTPHVSPPAPASPTNAAPDEQAIPSRRRDRQDETRGQVQAGEPDRKGSVGIIVSRSDICIL